MFLKWRPSTPYPLRYHHFNKKLINTLNQFLETYFRILEHVLHVLPWICLIIKLPKRIIRVNILSVCVWLWRGLLLGASKTRWWIDWLETGLIDMDGDNREGGAGEAWIIHSGTKLDPRKTVEKVTQGRPVSFNIDISALWRNYADSRRLRLENYLCIRLLCLSRGCGRNPVGTQFNIVRILIKH